MHITYLSLVSSKQLCCEGEMVSDSSLWQLAPDTRGLLSRLAEFECTLSCATVQIKKQGASCFDLLVVPCFPPGDEEKKRCFGFVFASKPQSTSRSHIFPSCLNSLTIGRHFLIVVPFLNTQKSRYLSGQRYVQYHCLGRLFESVFVINVQMPWELICSKRSDSREV